MDYAKVNSYIALCLRGQGHITLSKHTKSLRTEVQYCISKKRVRTGNSTYSQTLRTHSLSARFAASLPERMCCSR